MKPVNLGHLETFVAVLRHGSFPAATQRLDVTQPAPLSPRLHRTLAVVMRRDKRLHAGLSDLVRALKALSAES